MKRDRIMQSCSDQMSEIRNVFIRERGRVGVRKRERGYEREK